MKCMTITLGNGARLDCYVLSPEISTGKEKVRPAVVICPGGGYLKCATREQEVVAARFLGMGYHAFVLRYHTLVVPGAGSDDVQLDLSSHYPVQIVDLMQAVACVRSHSEEWRLVPDRVYALGFSAGGHVVGSLAERFDDADLLAMAGATAEEVRPDAVVLSYPMVDAGLVRDALASELDPSASGIPNELVARALFGADRPSDEDFDRVDLALGVRADMPPLFVWQTADDDLLRAQDTVRFAARAIESGVPCELHVFQRGVHGMSLCDSTSSSKPSDEDGAAAAWVGLAQTWLGRLVGEE